MPKHTDDKDARGAAMDLVAVNDSNPVDIMGAFPIVEFETATKTVEGETVILRRVVLVGPWEVVK